MEERRIAENYKTKGASTETDQDGHEIKIAPRIIVQAGAYYLLLIDEREQAQLMEIVSGAAKKGFDHLRNGGTAIEAVEKAVCLLESSKYFNAGRGSLLNKQREVECDAMIMDGRTLNTGAVMAARHFKHPVSISRKIMEESDHCALNGDGALEFAKEKGFLDLICDPEDLIVEHVKKVKGDFSNYVLLLGGHAMPTETGDEHSDVRINYDTVSAVALDSYGHFACATSTGGIPGKSRGRVGDAPLVGCGGYANEFGAATASGHGEALIKLTLAREIVFNMEKLDATESTKNAVQKMQDRVPHGYGCAIAIDKDGNFGKATNSTVMLWAKMADDKLEYGMERAKKINYD